MRTGDMDMAMPCFLPADLLLSSVIHSLQEVPVSSERKPCDNLMHKREESFRPVKRVRGKNHSEKSDAAERERLFPRMMWTTLQG